MYLLWGDNMMQKINIHKRNIFFCIASGTPIPQGYTQDGNAYMGTQIDVVYENNN